MPQQCAGFLSYAHADTVLVERLIDLLRPRCANLRELELGSWWDQRILAGEYWEQEVATAMDAADFGLFCISPSFLASRYVTEVELPAFLPAARAIIPVGLEAIDCGRADLKGLEALQIFRYRRRGAKSPLWFAECAGINRARFCDDLVAQMADRMKPCCRN
ncbi:MAG TPA: toll/interleukin-1 receptor domain-containing protein [Solirubrobacteraceae bacterium]|nr:toll/interleukin-1 receptor domain-containing protein [Solirubrobacteraceae bacterium]